VATLYIHGVGADWSTWTPLMQAEAACGMDTHDQLFINMPGFGDSENMLGVLDIADVGATFLSVARSLGYSRLRLVGHSMGGFLTLDMASRYPEAIESIHLIAGPYFSILTSIQHPVLSICHDATVAATFGLQYLLAHTGRLEVALLEGLYRLGAFRYVLYPFASHPLQLKESVVRALCAQINPRGLLLTAANGDGYNADEQWAKIECPIWAVFGERDRLVPKRDMERLLKCQPAAICSTVKDVGHLLHIERPVSVVKGLRLWV
jgi:pimeloyl-ACP methyl ester carboxylesterase